MHDYSIDKHPKEKIIFVLAFIAIWVTPFASSFLEEMSEKLNIYNGWVIVIPVMLTFTLIYTLFDKYLWKVKWLRRFLLVPDLNGKWECKGQTTQKNGTQAEYSWESDMTITQSWSKLCVHSKAEQSVSKSIAASIYHDKGVGYKVLYQFINTPKVGESDLQIHSGTVELLFEENFRKATGYYYTDHHRSTVGKMELRKKGES